VITFLASEASSVFRRYLSVLLDDGGTLYNLSIVNMHPRLTRNQTCSHWVASYTPTHCSAVAFSVLQCKIHGLCGILLWGWSYCSDFCNSVI